MRSTYATRLSAGGVADEFVTQLLRQGDAKVFKVLVSANGQIAEAGKGQEILIGDQLKKNRFDSKREDDLYAWSNERSEYEAAASYQSAQSVAAGYGSSTPGWLWNGMFDSWAWIPGADLAFFNPFGYGLFAPGVVGYAPICFGHTIGGRWRGPWHGFQSWVPLPVNPRRPPARGATPRSPWQNHLASAAASKAFARTGFHSARGGSVPVGTRMTSSSAPGGFWSRSSETHVMGGSGGHVGGWARSASAGRGSGWATAGSGGGGRSFGNGGSGGGGGHAGGGGGSSGGGHR